MHFRLAHLHLTLASFTVEEQDYEHFECECFRNDDKQENVAIATQWEVYLRPTRKLCIIRLQVLFFDFNSKTKSALPA